jgi:hypothetical protein
MMERPSCMPGRQAETSNPIQTAVRTEASWDEAYDTLAAAEAGDFGKVITRCWSPDLSLMSGATRLGDAEIVREAMDVSLAAASANAPPTWPPAGR